ncbi:MAG: hypothetical protein D3905_06360 [Candidatus Electrothrix sp. AS4_5]|nr:hypothetical protein [Candidatus Electrothrix gigas]
MAVVCRCIRLGIGGETVIPLCKFIFFVNYHPKAVKERVSREPTLCKLKIEFFKDQYSPEEYGEVFPLVDCRYNTPNIHNINLKKKRFKQKPSSDAIFGFLLPHCLQALLLNNVSPLLVSVAVYKKIKPNHF